MLEKAKAVVDQFRGTVRFAAKAVLEPRAFVSDFFSGPYAARRWMDLAALVVLYVGASIAAGAFGAGPNTPLPSSPWMIGAAMVIIGEAAVRATLLHPILRVLGGEATFDVTLQSLAFPQLTAALVAVPLVAAFCATGFVGFAVLAPIVTLALGVPSSVVALAAAHRIAVWRSGVALLGQLAVLNAAVMGILFTSSQPLPSVLTGITPRRTAALDLTACMMAPGGGSVFDIPTMRCAPSEEVADADGGVSHRLVAGAVFVPSGERPESGQDGGWTFCKCPQVSPDMKRQVALARACVDRLKTGEALELRDSALLFLAAHAAAEEECDFGILTTRALDFFRLRQEALAWW